MKKKFTNLIVLPAALLLSLVCNKPVEKAPSTPSSIGLWLYVFPVIPTITTEEINIWLDINDDESYSLELIELSNKKLFSSNGTWNATDDSIFLTGSDCTILDKIPDTLTQLDAAACQKPIRLIKPEKADRWTIQTLSLTSMLGALPIPDSVVSIVPIFFPEIKLQKSND